MRQELLKEEEECPKETRLPSVPIHIGTGNSLNFDKTGQKSRKRMEGLKNTSEPVLRRWHDGHNKGDTRKPNLYQRHLRGIK